VAAQTGSLSHAFHADVLQLDQSGRALVRLITQQAIRRGLFERVRQLISSIQRYVDQYNVYNVGSCGQLPPTLSSKRSAAFAMLFLGRNTSSQCLSKRERQARWSFERARLNDGLLVRVDNPAQLSGFVPCSKKMFVENFSRSAPAYTPILLLICCVRTPFLTVKRRFS
jgi:hypothetical protein